MSEQPKSEFNYVLYKPENKCFYRPQNCNYTRNPELAGLYTEEYAKKYEQDCNGAVKAYRTDSRFVKTHQKRYDEGVVYKLLSTLECVPPESRLLLVGRALKEKAKNDSINYPPREYKS